MSDPDADELRQTAWRLFEGGCDVYDVADRLEIDSDQAQDFFDQWVDDDPMTARAIGLSDPDPDPPEPIDYDMPDDWAIRGNY